MARAPSIDRVSELALLVLAAAIAWQGAALFPPRQGEGSAGAPLASLCPASPPPSSELDRVRLLVDGNGAGAREAALGLAASFPGSAGAWEILGRFLEGAGEEGPAVRAWARAVRLDPGLGDRGSPAYLGGRIGALAERSLARLRKAKAGRALSPAEGEELDAVYYLRRRLAGGCE